MRKAVEGLFRRHGALLAVVLFSIGLGLPVLDNGLVNYDDNRIIVEQAGRGRLDWTAGNLSGLLHADPERSWMPLRTLVLMACHAVGGTSPRAYHLASLVLYVLLCVLVYLFIRAFLAPADEPAGRLGRANIWALLGAFLFASSPLNVESLAWASAIKDLLAGVFWMASVLALIYSSRGWRRGVYFSALFFVLAVLSKPSAVVLPAVLALCLWLGPVPREKYPVDRKAVFLFALPLLALLVYLVPHLGVIAGKYGTGAGAGSVAAGALQVFFSYIRSFFLPFGLSVRYFERIPLSMLNAATITYLGLLLAALGGAIVLWRKGRGLPLFCLLWMLVAFLPSSGVAPLEILRADRYALMLLPALALLTAAALREIVLRMPDGMRRPVMALTWVLPVLFSVVFIGRTRVWEDSRTLWTDVLSREPGHYLALSGLGAVAAESGDTARAVTLYRRALESNPDAVSAMHNLAVLLEDRGETGRARELLLEAASRQWDRRDSIERLASFYFRHDSLASAEALLEKALVQWPDDAGLHYLLGLTLGRLGDAAGAGENLLAATRSDPDNPVYLVALGRLYSAQDIPERAVGYLERALNVDPDNVAAYSAFGELFAGVGQLQDAVLAYRAALERDSTDADALRGLAAVYGSLGETVQAAGMLERLVENDPGDCLALINLSAARFSLGRAEQAAAAAERAIGCDSLQPAAYANAALAFAGLGQYDRARELLRRGSRRLPNDPTVLFHRAQLALRSGEPTDTALFYLKKVFLYAPAGELSQRTLTLIDSLSAQVE